MFAYRLRTAALALTAAVGLSACSYGYGPYGQSGLSVGIGSGYYDPYYSGYGYGYGAGYPGYGYGYPGYGYAYAPYWGWYDNFYYPGTGFYVYDIYRKPYRWTDAQRRYWNLRRERALATSTTQQPVVIRENWNDFSRDRVRSRPLDRNSNRVERRQTTNVERSRPVRAERQRVERSQSTNVERSRPARIERAERRSSSDSASRQLVREQRRSEIRAERASRSEGRGRGNNRED